MPQSTSSNALTTRRHTNTTSYGRSRRVTTFTAAPPVSTDPHRDLVAAVYAWGRIAVPVTDPDPCPVAWCMDCLVGTVDGLDQGTVIHDSAAAIVEAISLNGTATDAKQLTVRVLVNRVELTDDAGDVNSPATAVLRFGNGDYLDLSSAKAMEVSAALTKARVSAQGLDGERKTGAVSVVRTGNGTLQIGALFTADGPVVFINMLTILTAADVREIARGEGYPCPPDSWDLTPAAAAHLAAAVDAAAVLAAADRAVTA